MNVKGRKIKAVLVFLMQNEDKKMKNFDALQKCAC